MRKPLKIKGILSGIVLILQEKSMDEREQFGVAENTLTGGEEQNLGISADLIRGH